MYALQMEAEMALVVDGRCVGLAAISFSVSLFRLHLPYLGKGGHRGFGSAAVS